MFPALSTGIIPLAVRETKVYPEGVDKVLTDRLKSLIKRSGKSAREVSIAATGKPDVVRDIIRGKVQSPRGKTLSELARVLGSNVGYLTGEARTPKRDGAMQDGIVYARVLSIAQAGAFVEVSDLGEPDPADERRIATVADHRFPNLDPVAFEVAGDSINLRCEAGGFAVGFSFAETGLELRAGMWIVADRVRGSLVERTIKQVHGTKGHWELHPASTNPKHKPIRFPSAERHEEIVVIAVIRRFISPELPI